MTAIVIPFPTRSGIAEQWIARNPEVFFIDAEPRSRRCSLCNKRISPGSRYFGMREIRCEFDAAGDLQDLRITERVAARLHPMCSKEL
jgi:hypothetical protein